MHARRTTVGGRLVAMSRMASALALLIFMPATVNACNRSLKLERDWMVGDKPGCSAFVSEMSNCGWTATIKDDDGNLTAYEYATQVPGGLQAYLESWENDPTPATGHKVHILGAEFYDPQSQDVGHYWDDGCCHSVAVVAVKACAERGPGWEPCVSNHEIGHQFQNTTHCTTNTQCVMYHDGPTTPTAFCTTGYNHRSWISSHSP